MLGARKTTSIDRIGALMLAELCHIMLNCGLCTVEPLIHARPGNCRIVNSVTSSILLMACVYTAPLRRTRVLRAPRRTLPRILETHTFVVALCSPTQAAQLFQSHDCVIKISSKLIPCRMLTKGFADLAAALPGRSSHRIAVSPQSGGSVSSWRHAGGTAYRHGV